MHAVQILTFIFCVARAVRFCNATTQLAMVRVPRAFYGMVRGAVCFVTRLGLQNRRRVVLSVLSVSGSARTAKLRAMQQVRNSFRERILQSRRLERSAAVTAAAATANQQQPSIKEAHRICREFQETLTTIQSIDY